MLRNSRTMVRPKCSTEKTETPISISRKQFEKKRSESLKDNVNKLLAIASNDVKEYSAFFKELDEIHKKELEQFADKLKDKFSKSTKSNVTVVEVDDENIFIDKD